MKNQTQKQKPCRQGDVLVLPVDSIPEGLKTTKRVTLALGEVTGHHHTIHNGAIGYADDEDQLAEYFEVFENAPLTHQEHNTITFTPRKYRSVIQVQYTPEALVRVAD